MEKKHDPIRLGIIGCGRVAEERHLPALIQIPDIRVVALSDVDSNCMARLGDRFGITNRFVDHRSLLEREDVDAVGILTPTQSHAEIGLAAMESGKHVFIEKPLALNLEECDHLMAHSREWPSKVVVGFNLRWHRLIRKARCFIQTGALGPVRAIRSVYTHFRSGENAPDWHRKLSLGGGVAFNEGVHHFDLWRYLLDREVEEVFSYSRPSDHYEDETHVTTARLSGGVLASGTFTFSTSPNSELEIYGESGRLYLSCYRFDGMEFFPNSVYPGDLFDRLRKVARTIKDIPEVIPVLRRGGDFSATFYRIWEHFLACVRQDAAPGCTLEDGRHALQVALAAVESATSQKPVALAI